MSMIQSTVPTLHEAYVEIERIVADFERDGEVSVAKDALERVVRSLPDDVKETLAEIHSLHEEGRRLDAEIESRSRQKNDLILRHRLSNRPPRARRIFTQG